MVYFDDIVIVLFYIISDYWVQMVSEFLTICVFGLLKFFPLPYTICLGVSALKILIILYLKPPTLFVIGLEI